MGRQSAAVARAIARYTQRGLAPERAARRHLPVGAPDRRDHVGRQLDAVQLARPQPREVRASSRGSRRARSSWSTPARSTTSRRSCSSPARCRRRCTGSSGRTSRRGRPASALFVVVYYMNGASVLVDPSVHDVDKTVAVTLSISALFAGWLIYDGLWRTSARRNPRLATIALDRDAVRLDLRVLAGVQRPRRVHADRRADRHADDRQRVDGASCRRSTSSSTRRRPAASRIRRCRSARSSAASTTTT